MIMNCCVDELRTSFQFDMIVAVVDCPHSDAVADCHVVSYQYYKNAGIFAQFLIALVW